MPPGVEGVHANKWGYPNILGVSKHMGASKHTGGNPNIKGTSKHTGNASK